MNEGLASYMEAVLADAYQPGMGYLTNFFTDMTSEGACAKRCERWKQSCWMVCEHVG
jgi:hypothetical protein